MLTELPIEEKYIHQWRHNGIIYTFSWLGNGKHQPDRVYALAFTTNRQLLMVTNNHWSPACWLPGGGVEAGETPEQALARELIEEANATIINAVRLGFQLAESSQGVRSIHAFYWARVQVRDAFQPDQEVTERHLIAPDAFLDILFWGRSDPKAKLLLNLALEIENSQSK